MSLADDPDLAAAIRSGLDASLKRLGIHYVDIYHLHGVSAARYDFAASVLAPSLTRFGRGAGIASFDFATLRTNGERLFSLLAA